MPIRIEDRRRAHFIEPFALSRRELELSRREIILELCLGPPADNERGDARPAEEPGKRHSCARNAARFGDIDDHIDDLPESALLIDRRLLPAGKLTRSFRGLL